MNPLHQFEVKTIAPIKIGTWDLSFTNSSLFMMLSVFVSCFFLWVLVRRRALIPTTGQSVIETLYGFIKSTAKDSIGHGYEAYLPFIFSVFIMVFMGNFLGLFPYSFTFTSQLAPVGIFAVLGLFVSMAVGIYHSGLHWFKTFMPKGIPLVLAPIVIPIELISFLAKPFSLTVRLVMNMVVGHILLKILAGFVFSSGLAGVLPLIFVGILLIFELGIAFLQAYIFTILTSIYLGEALHSH
ncbi:MAG: F0F1 ATP synthase subunit A [Lactobacillales bacterium]|jgi:F-type H+-transporting ATPase subunit a|nr:F0F1 ATP synthase subunit A [Lactobacillales bacterium]